MHSLLYPKSGELFLVSDVLENPFNQFDNVLCRLADFTKWNKQESIPALFSRSLYYERFTESCRVSCGNKDRRKNIFRIFSVHMMPREYFIFEMHSPRTMDDNSVGS